MGIPEKAARVFRVNALDLTLNPVVTFWTLGWLWAFIIWMYVQPEHSMTEYWWWKRRIEYAFIWLYYATRNIWIVFLAWLYFSKWGNFVLGKDQNDTEVEYSDFSWVLMMFSAGMGIALHYFGVAEPVFHLNQSVQHIDRAQSFFSYNTASQEGIFLTFFNFGIHGWAPFVIVALALGWAHYRRGLPLAFRSIFYPLLQDRIYGWLGDAIDFLAAFCTFIAVSTMTGLCVIMFVSGMNWISPWLPYTGFWGKNIQNTDTMVDTLFIASSVGVFSVLCGINWGARRWTEMACVFSVFVPLMIFLMDDNWYLFNLMTEMVGYYLFYFFKIAHHVDAFQKLDSGIDVAKTGRNQLSPWYDGYGGTGFYQADKVVQDGGFGQLGMTGIHWGWWMSLAPFVGIWIAKISKGRTIKQIIHWGLLFPVLFCFGWITIMGGLGIKMERRAVIDGCRCACATTNAMDTFDIKYCGTVGLNPTGQDALSMYYEGGPHGGEPYPTNSTATCDTLRPSVRGEPGGCPSIVQPSKKRPEKRWFLLLDEYMTNGYATGAKNMGRFLSGVTLTALVMWLVVIMDVGSWAIDAILSGGENKPHRLWRILMLFTSLALTIALIRAGARHPMYDSTTALQVTSFIIGMIFTLFLTAVPVCLYEGLVDSEENSIDSQTRWTQGVGTGIADVWEVFFSLGKWKIPAGIEWFRFFVGLLFPYYLLPVAYGRLDKRQVCGPLSAVPFIALFTAFCWWVFVALHIVEGSYYYYKDDKVNGVINGDEGMWAIAWSGYIAFCGIVAGCRYSIRQLFGIKGNLVQDFFLSLFFYPLVIAQIDAQEPVEVQEKKAAPAKKEEAAKGVESQPAAEVAVPSAVQMQYSPFPHPAMVGAGFYGPQIPRTVPMPLAYSLPI